MKLKTVLKLIAILVFVVVVAGIGYYFLLLPQLNQNKVATVVPDKLFGWKFPAQNFPLTVAPGSNLFDFEIIAYSSIRDPGGIPSGLPVRLKIPIIGVDSAIEDALITPDGRMDVPAGAKDVAWFALGPQPGQVGSAVIGGHYGISGTTPWVFYNLNKVKVGDKVYVVDDEGNTLTFMVRSITSFNRDADATTVFTSSDGLAHLNIITCEGIWNQVNGTYPQRLVVFTDQIPSEGPAPVGVVPISVATNPTSVTPVVTVVNTAPPSITAFNRPLSVGSQGADVIVLQNALIQKGFLSMPAGITKGYFGVLTKVAVTKYQASVGLPSIGIFGPMTRAKLVSELAMNPVLPNTGNVSGSPVSPQSATSSNNPASSSSLPQTIVKYLESVYATPTDGLITSLLLMLIIFVVFKIIQP